MKKQILFTAMLVSSAVAIAKNPETTMTFGELPYSEGTLYVSIEEEGKNILMKALEIDGDSVSFAADLSEYNGRKISVKAFQDLNDNKQLDMDAFGRPTEPCLKSTYTPAPDRSGYNFRLVQY